MQHTIVMTGASRGIGRVAAEHMLRRSPNVHPEYSTSKLATIYLVHEYARRLPAGIDVRGTGQTGAERCERAGRRIMPMLTLTPLATSPHFVEASALGGAAAGLVPHQGERCLMRH
ncbi:hypothetical protein OHB53_23730 [Streptomyces sp. NBC_00056]|uniref:hypothetical protein n=1 Tax=Streptomyces sp. NBC_00056 TaxID=2975633 RepID=UPI00324CB233